MYFNFDFVHVRDNISQFVVFATGGGVDTRRKRDRDLGGRAGRTDWPKRDAGYRRRRTGEDERFRTRNGAQEIVIRGRDDLRKSEKYELKLSVHPFKRFLTLINF